MRHPGGSYRSALAALVLAALLVVAARAQAGQGFSLSLPLAPNPPIKGLSMVFDCTWAYGPGYLPVRLTINCTPPAAANRTLSVRISNGGSGAWRPVTLTTDIEIPAGSTGTTEVIPFPRLAYTYQLSCHVWENGRQIDELSFEEMSLMTTAVGQQSAPATLFVSTSQVDVGGLDFMTGANVYSGQTVGAMAPQAVPVTPNNPNAPPPTLSVTQVAPFVLLPPSALFENWLNYSSLDVIVISLADVEDLAANRPRVWQALRRWTKAGGNLCVFGVGEDWHGLAALEQRLEWPASAADAEQPERGWKRPRRSLFNANWETSGGGAIAVEETPGDADADAEANLEPKPPEQPPFLNNAVGLGQVVALAEASPFPGKTTHWRWLFNTLGQSRTKWETRHGVTPDNGTDDFDNFLIADVGLPPVKAYRVLITVFVVAIGPINYWLLRRQGRLHWLLFTVPAAAVVVSLALIAYAIIADGFQTYLRARSYTQLDQRHDQAVSTARLSYYAGVAPADGLIFGRDTAIYLLDREQRWYRGGGAPRFSTWMPEQQLTRGWLPSRTPAQYMTVRPYACQRELRIAESADAMACVVENALDTRIKHLLLRGAGGSLFYAADLAPGGKAGLERLGSDEATEQCIVKMLSERNRNQLMPPADASTPASELLFGGPRPSYYRSTNYQQFGVVGGSLLEEGIDRSFQEVSSKLPEPRNYVAIVERPLDISAGMDGLAERQSLHVIHGIW